MLEKPNVFCLAGNYDGLPPNVNTPQGLLTFRP